MTKRNVHWDQFGVGKRAVLENVRAGREESVLDGLQFGCLMADQLSSKCLAVAEQFQQGRRGFGQLALGLLKAAGVSGNLCLVSGIVLLSPNLLDLYEGRTEAYREKTNHE